MKKIKYDIIHITLKNRKFEIYNKNNTKINPDSKKTVENFLEQLNEKKLSIFLQYGIYLPALFFIYIILLPIFAILQIFFMIGVVFFLFVFNMFMLGVYHAIKISFINKIKEIYYLEKDKLNDFYQTQINVPFLGQTDWYKIKFSLRPMIKFGFEKNLKRNFQENFKKDFEDNSLGKNDSLKIKLENDYPEFEDVVGNHNPHFNY